jgi:hypothetical protein
VVDLISGLKFFSHEEQLVAGGEPRHRDRFALDVGDDALYGVGDGLVGLVVSLGYVALGR